MKIECVAFVWILLLRDLALTKSKSNLDSLSRHIRAVQEECSENLTVEFSGDSIKSPGYPDRYPSNQDCRWILSAPEDANIVLTIKSLDLEKDRNCELDYLRIYEGPSSLSQPIEQLCGSIRNKIISTNSSQVLLVFHSDPSYEDKGFHIEYHLQMTSGCSAELNTDSGAINSPGFPNNYPDDTDCWTMISVNENNMIIFQFNVLDLEFDDNCTYDYVEVYDGAMQDAPLVGRFCLPTQKMPIHSTNNKLLVHFHSDHLISKRGFQAQYTSISANKNLNLTDLGGCLWEEVGLNGSIASPNYPQKYPDNANCNILITAPSDSFINLVFDAIQLEVDANCSYDYIEIVEGANTDSQGKKICGKENEQRKFTTSQNILLVLFRSDDFLQFSGFKARYSFQKVKNESANEKHTEEKKSNSKEDATAAESFIQEDIFLEKPHNVTIAIGSPLMLHCAVGDPIAKIRWLKDEQFLGGNTPLPGMKLVANNTLWIQGMNRNLAGMYTCAAVTPEKTYYTNAWVKLEHDSNAEETPCDIVFMKEPRNSSFTEGEYAYMECLAVGSQLQVYWEKDGHRLETKKRIIVARNGFLSIDDVTMKDAGPYTCVTIDKVTGCQKRIQAVLTVNSKAKLFEICGKPRIGTPSGDQPHEEHGKIVGGHNAEEGAYPWQVMLWDPGEKAFCGGTLINERWIITAAHCFKNYLKIRWEDVRIKLGKYNREEKEDQEIETVIADQASAVIVHPAYSKVTFDNDLALVRLRDHVKFTDHILPVCLGSPQLLDEIIRSRKIAMGTVTGWGKLTLKGGSPKYLQEIQMPVIDQSICVKSTNYTVTRNMFCAGYAQEIIGDACHGDSGGPFIIQHEGKWYLYGIVSWGEGCGQRNKYGFYTRVRSYMSWITGIMKS